MKIEELLLSKEEIPITHNTSFYVPIHPMLLDPSTKLDDNLAQKVFMEAANDWYNDLLEHAKTLPETDRNRIWYQDVFLKERPRIVDKKQTFPSTNISGWNCEVYPGENGFAQTISVARNSGSLYFNEEDSQCMLPLTLNSKHSIKFTPEKKIAYRYQDKRYGALSDDSLALIHVYAKHNVDYFPAALFLRNWAVLYLNEAMRKTLSKRK